MNPEHLEPTVVGTGQPPLDGSWERAGRSPASAAVAALLIIGVVYFIAQTALQLAGITIASLLDPRSPGPPGDTSDILKNLSTGIGRYALPIQIALVISQFLFMLLPTWAIVRKWHSSSVRQYIRLVPARAVEVILAVIATLMIIPTGEFIAGLIVKYAGVSDEFSKMGQQLLTAHSLPEFLWLVVVVAVTPAICEEILFRGYVQRTLERVIGLRSVWVVGVVFGLFHMQPFGLITLAIIGIMLGYLCHRSHSLYPSMAAHFTNNFLALYLLWQPPTLFGTDLAKAGEIPAIWVVVTLPLAVAALLVFRRVTARPAAS